MDDGRSGFGVSVVGDSTRSTRAARRRWEFMQMGKVVGEGEEIERLRKEEEEKEKEKAWLAIWQPLRWEKKR